MNNKEKHILFFNEIGAMLGKPDQRERGFDLANQFLNFAFSENSSYPTQAFQFVFNHVFNSPSQLTRTGLTAVILMGVGRIEIAILRDDLLTDFQMQFENYAFTLNAFSHYRSEVKERIIDLVFPILDGINECKLDMAIGLYASNLISEKERKHLENSLKSSSRDISRFTSDELDKLYVLSEMIHEKPFLSALREPTELLPTELARLDRLTMGLNL